MDRYLLKLEHGYKRHSAGNLDVSEDIQMLFHPNTLNQLMYLRQHLLAQPMTQWSPEKLMLAGTVAGILHGAHRANGTSMYLSISMPNTFSMPPTYVKKFIRENGLNQIDQNVFERLRDKLARIYMDSIEGPAGETLNRDASKLLGDRKIEAQSVDLVVTSPPYLKVVNYGTSNWIRLWWLGIDDVSRHGGAGRHALDAQLDHRHTYTSYREFMLRTFQGVSRVLKKRGVAVFVIGDVASPGRSSVELASEIWSDVGDRSGLRLLELIKDSLPAQNKVSRIWGDTRGRATEQEGVLVLGTRRWRRRRVALGDRLGGAVQGRRARRRPRAVPGTTAGLIVSPVCSRKLAIRSRRYQIPGNSGPDISNLVPGMSLSIGLQRSSRTHQQGVTEQTGQKLAPSLGDLRGSGLRPGHVEEPRERATNGTVSY